MEGLFMKIMPIDISHKVFNKKMMGYDAHEVHEYLQDIANQMESLIQERNTLKETLRDKEMSLIEYRERDQVLKSTIQTATQMAERLRQDAERESNLIINDAQQKADHLISDSKENLRKIYNDISELKRMRMQFEANLRALAQAHLTLMDQGEKYLPQMNLPNHSIVQQDMNTEISPLSSR